MRTTTETSTSYQQLQTVSAGTTPTGGTLRFNMSNGYSFGFRPTMPFQAGKTYGDRGTVLLTGETCPKGKFFVAAFGSYTLGGTATTVFAVFFYAICTLSIGPVLYVGAFALNLPEDPGVGYYAYTQGGYLLGRGNDDVLSFMGTFGQVILNAPMVAMAATPTGGGYWMAASDGGIFSAGNAPYYGSMGGKPLDAPIVGFTPTADGHGYWEVASDGGIFAFGDARFDGSMGGKPLNEPIVGMAVDYSTGGYWLIASDGGLFAFTAPYYGSMGGKPLNEPMVGMAAMTTGGGYWEVASDGGIFSFGQTNFFGSTGNIRLNKPIVGMVPTPGDGGYWFVASDGGLFAYGNAPFDGSFVTFTTAQYPTAPTFTFAGMAVT